MNPVVGLDVAKGESQVQAFLDKSKPFGKSFSMKHIVTLANELEDYKIVQSIPGIGEKIAATIISEKLVKSIRFSNPKKLVAFQE